MKSIKLMVALAVLIIIPVLVGGACNGGVGNQPPVITSLAADVDSVTVGSSVTVTCIATDPDGDSLSYSWSSTGGSLSGSGYALTWKAPDAGGSYSISVKVSDGQGSEVEESCEVTVEAGEANRPPVIQSLSMSPGAVEPQKNGTLTCVATDPDGDPLTYSWWTELGRIDGEGSVVTYVGAQYVGEYDVEVHVRDNRGGNAVETITVTVAMNEAPEIDKLKADPSVVLTDYSSTITCTASDPDGDTINYSWTADGGTLSGSGDTVSWLSPGRAGYFTITVTIDDGRGLSDTKSVTIQVQGLKTTLNIRPESEESGAVRSDDKLVSLWTVGDDSLNNGIRTFLSFDLSRIDMVEEFRVATLAIETIDRNGQPWTDLGDLLIDIVEYGERAPETSDYDMDGTRLERYSATPLEEIDMTQLITRALEDGDARFQIRVYFQSETDEDGQPDNLKVVEAVLRTYYVESTD